MGAMSASIQISALAGVIVGAGPSYITTLLTERARWRRQQDVRWDERRLVAYGDYVRSVKDIATIVQGLASHRGIARQHTPLEPTPENLARLHAAETERSSLIETVRLLTDTDTISAARHLNHCIWHLTSLALGQSSGGEATRETAFAEYRKARDEYHRCARTTLSIPGVAIPRDLTWPPRWTQQAPAPPPGGAPPI